MINKLIIINLINDLELTETIHDDKNQFIILI